MWSSKSPLEFSAICCYWTFLQLNRVAALVPSSNSVRLRAAPFVTLSCRALISTKGLQVEKGRPASTEPFCRWCCRTEQELHLGAPDNTFEPYIRYYKSIVQFIQVLSLFSAIIIYSMVCWAVPNKRYGWCKKPKPISVQKLDFTSIENLRGHFSTKMKLGSIQSKRLVFCTRDHYKGFNWGCNNSSPQIVFEEAGWFCRRSCRNQVGESCFRSGILFI